MVHCVKRPLLLYARLLLFDSSGGQAQDFNEIPIEAVYDVGVRVWDPQTCICLGTLAGDRAGVEVTR